ncbi:MAG: hypothetical protein FJZ95_03110, partial [Chloroflexi bacterium]|nr:hypothetical protein [Chloroflexota bacterium]
MPTFGYAGEILKIDLSTGEVLRLHTGDYADRFVGGRGIAVKFYWDEASPYTDALDPVSPLIFV